MVPLHGTAIALICLSARLRSVGGLLIGIIAWFAQRAANPPPVRVEVRHPAVATRGWRITRCLAAIRTEALG